MNGELQAWGGTDLSAILAKDQSESENAVSRILQTQQVEFVGTYLCRGKHHKSAFP
jgi:hypothetical protein